VVVSEECARYSKRPFPFPHLYTISVAGPSDTGLHEVARKRRAVHDTGQKALNGGFSQVIVEASPIRGFRDVAGCGSAEKDPVLAETLPPATPRVPCLDSGKKLRARQFTVIPEFCTERLKND
jgi:hypothetical protein